MLNLINPGDGHPLCTFHRTARLDAGGIGEIPFTKDNQVNSSYTQAGLYRGGPLYLYLLKWMLYNS